MFAEPQATFPQQPYPDGGSFAFDQAGLDAVLGTSSGLLAAFRADPVEHKRFKVVVLYSIVNEKSA